MEIQEKDAAATTEYADDTYYFCSTQCRDKFVADPEKFVSRDDSSQS